MRVVGTTVGLVVGIVLLALFPQDRWGTSAFLSVYLIAIGSWMPVSRSAYAWYVAGFPPPLIWASTCGDVENAFVAGGTLHVEGSFRETQLGAIAVGDRAVITLMGHGSRTIEGRVESIGWAINPPNVATTTGTGGLVPQVQPTFDWIRLAQRVPVRVRIDDVPDDVRLVAGTTASVAIRKGS